MIIPEYRILFPAFFFHADSCSLIRDKLQGMKSIVVKIEKSPEGDWWVSSPDAFGFFAVGDTREEALENALDGLSIHLDCEPDELKLEIEENSAGFSGKS